MAGAALLALALTLGADASAPAAPAEGAATEARAPAAPDPDRRIMLGLEGVAWMTGPVHIARFGLPAGGQRPVSTPLGMGLLLRYAAHPLVSVEIGTRSGSLRYREADGRTQLAVDHFAPTLGVVLWPLRRRVVRLGVDAGAGGVYSTARLDEGDARSRQHWGSAVLRTGAALELGGPRLALLVHLHGHGLVTPRGAASGSGPRFRGDPPPSEGGRPPVPRHAAWASASMGLGYRF